jgi:uncharacterized protein (DUF2384 family)
MTNSVSALAATIEGEIPEQILDLATEIFAGRDAALTWFSRASRALDFAVPIELCRTDDGRDELLTYLRRVLEGVYT